MFLTALFFLLYSSGKGNKRKNTQMGLHHTEKFLHGKGNHQHNKRHPAEWENIPAVLPCGDLPHLTARPWCPAMAGKSNLNTHNPSSHLSPWVGCVSPKLTLRKPKSWPLPAIRGPFTAFIGGPTLLVIDYCNYDVCFQSLLSLPIPYSLPSPVEFFKILFIFIALEIKPKNPSMVYKAPSTLVLACCSPSTLIAFQCLLFSTFWPSTSCNSSNTQNFFLPVLGISNMLFFQSKICFLPSPISLPFFSG